MTTKGWINLHPKKMKQKVTIFQKRHWEKEDLNGGGQISKDYYACFPEKGKPFEFSTSTDRIHDVHEGLLKYNPEQSEEVDLVAQFNSFRGEMKMLENGSQGE